MDLTNPGFFGTEAGGNQHRFSCQLLISTGKQHASSTLSFHQVFQEVT